MQQTRFTILLMKTEAKFSAELREEWRIRHVFDDPVIKLCKSILRSNEDKKG